MLRELDFKSKIIEKKRVKFEKMSSVRIDLFLKRGQIFIIIIETCGAHSRVANCLVKENNCNLNKSILFVKGRCNGNMSVTTAFPYSMYYRIPMKSMPMKYVNLRL